MVEVLVESYSDELDSHYKKIDDNLYLSGEEGYWSNLDKEENRELISSLNDMSAPDAIRKYHPYLYDVIFSPKRWGGLEFLNIKGNESCVDFGCMWGALTIGLAHRCGHVIGIDQTSDSLRFLKKRVNEENLNNVDLICANLKTVELFNIKFDVGVVNGVLEWIPEEGPIELKAYYGKHCSKDYSKSPEEQQIAFLKKVHKNLNENGKIYLAIENRYDFKMFLGINDPHSPLRFTSILPRTIASIISKIGLGRPYVNWLYSFKGIEKILKESGYSDVKLYMCFPDYRFPEVIMPYGVRLEYTDIISRFIIDDTDLNKSIIKKSIKKYVRYFLAICNMIFPVNWLAPSIIAIGKK
jgi:SAM-dependent methyltransferase